MSTYAIGVFLLLYGITALFSTQVPMWLVAIVALIAGVVVIAEGFRRKV